MFVNFDRLDPYQLLASTLRRSRPAMERTYAEAFRAHSRACALLKETLWAQLNPRTPLDPFGVFRPIPDEELPPEGYLDRLYADAQAEDIQCNQQATILILFADDALTRFARGVLGAGARPSDGYGPEYLDGVKLTALLRAGTNAVRHVSEWDDLFTTLPYPDPETLSKSSKEYQPMQSIRVLQRAFGIGKHDLIREVASWRIVMNMDGLCGTNEPSYDRFESRIVQAAVEIAQAGQTGSKERLDIELMRVPVSK